MFLKRFETILVLLSSFFKPCFHSRFIISLLPSFHPQLFIKKSCFRFELVTHASQSFKGLINCHQTAADEVQIIPTHAKSG